MIISYKKWVKILLRLFLIAMFMLSLYVAIKYPLEEESWFAYPTIIVCVYSWFHINVFKLEINENNLVRINMIKKVVINYAEVTKLEIYADHLIVKSKNSKVKVTSDLDRQKEAIAFVLDKLKLMKKDLKIKGDTKAVNKFLL
jgi:hypothetical protein